MPGSAGPAAAPPELAAAAPELRLSASAQLAARHRILAGAQLAGLGQPRRGNLRAAAW